MHFFRAKKRIQRVPMLTMAIVQTIHVCSRVSFDALEKSVCDADLPHPLLLYVIEEICAYIIALCFAAGQLLHLMGFTLEVTTF